MKVTDELLQVARAVRDAMVAEANDVHQFEQTCAGSLEMIDLHALIAAMPEAASLPAPTGPRWWWARKGGRWLLVEVDTVAGDVDPEADAVFPANSCEQYVIDDFDAWVGPLAEPAKEG